MFARRARHQSRRSALPPGSSATFGAPRAVGHFFAAGAGHGATRLVRLAARDVAGYASGLHVGARLPAISDGRTYCIMHMRACAPGRARRLPCRRSASATSPSDRTFHHARRDGRRTGWRASRALHALLSRRGAARRRGGAVLTRRPGAARRVLRRSAWGLGGRAVCAGQWTTGHLCLRAAGRHRVRRTSHIHGELRAMKRHLQAIGCSRGVTSFTASPPGSIRRRPAAAEDYNFETGSGIQAAAGTSAVDGKRGGRPRSARCGALGWRRATAQPRRRGRARARRARRPHAFAHHGGDGVSYGALTSARWRRTRTRRWRSTKASVDRAYMQARALDWLGGRADGGERWRSTSVAGRVHEPHTPDTFFGARCTHRSRCRGTSTSVHEAASSWRPDGLARPSRPAVSQQAMLVTSDNGGLSLTRL